MIEAFHLEKNYNKKVIHDLSFKMDQGDIVFVTGESGAGKTTLMRLLLGLEKPDSGSLKNDFEKISVVFQEDRLLEYLNILDNIKLVSDLDRESVLMEYKKILPEDAFFKKIKDYSGGMKRRASILRAVISDSSAIFLDEPFKGLDEENKQKTMEYVINNRRNRSLFIITHDMREAEIFYPKEVIRLTL